MATAVAMAAGKAVAMAVAATAVAMVESKAVTMAVPPVATMVAVAPAAAAEPRAAGQYPPRL